MNAFAIAVAIEGKLKEQDNRGKPRYKTVQSAIKAIGHEERRKGQVLPAEVAISQLIAAFGGTVEVM